MAKGGGTQDQVVTPAQGPEYDKLLGLASQGIDKGFFDKNFAGGADTRAGLTPEQLALQTRITGQGGVGQLGISALEEQLGAYDPNNPALTGAINMAVGDVNRNLEENLLHSIGDSAGAAGQFGSTRHGVAEGIALRGASEQAGDISTQMRLADMQAHGAGQDAAVANLGGITAGLESTVGGEQRESQSRIDDLFSKWEYESGVGLQDLMAFKGLVSGDMGGETTGASVGGK
jgi:hypothetical protein